MARPLRIQYENAFYHAMNRGLNRQKIFLNDRDRQGFLDLLQDCYQLFRAEVLAYCLMGNHYHLFLKTPRGNLSRIMRHLDGVYTQGFNRAHKRDGPLFRGRFKAILVDAESYLLQVSRYIHLNPVQAGLAQFPQDHLWSSYRHYLEPKNRPAFLQVGGIMDHFGNGAQAARGLEEFTLAGIDDETESFYSRKKTFPAFGSVEFINRVKDKIKIPDSHEEIPESKKPLPQPPDIDRVIQIVSQAYETPDSEIVKSRRRHVNEARSSAIYLARMLTGLTLNDIARRFGPCRYSTISRTVHAVRARIQEDSAWNKRLARMEEVVLEGRYPVKYKIVTPCTKYKIET